MRSQYYQRRRQSCSSHCSEGLGREGQSKESGASSEQREGKGEQERAQRPCVASSARDCGKQCSRGNPVTCAGKERREDVQRNRTERQDMSSFHSCKEGHTFAKAQASGTPLRLPGFLQKLFPHSSPGDLLALLILLLLISEGREDAKDTILTLLIFLLL